MQSRLAALLAKHALALLLLVHHAKYLQTTRSITQSLIHVQQVVLSVLSLLTMFAIHVTILVQPATDTWQTSVLLVIQDTCLKMGIVLYLGLVDSWLQR